MDSRTGKKIRLGRLFDRRSRRSIVVAYSHGVLMGPAPGQRSLPDMARMVEALRAAEGIMVAPGLVTSLEEAFVGRDRPSLVVHMDWQNHTRTVMPPARDGAVASLAAVEDVVAAGADAIMSYLYLGQDDPHLERLEVERNAHLARACDGFGLPLIVEPRSARWQTHPEDETDPALLSTYCRIGAEIGADVIKCVWPGSQERFAPVPETCPVPVLLAGGSLRGDVAETLRIAHDAVAAGAAGLFFGRNIFQAAQPARMLDALRAIVHDGAEVGASLDALG